MPGEQRSHLGRDPFEVPPEERDPIRRLRGRLPAAVTVWTTTAAPDRNLGVTVSSVLAVEGQPPELLGLIGPLTDFWDACQATKRFTIHVLSLDDHRLAGRFAGGYPGDPFEGLPVSPSPFGPQLQSVGTKASCELKGYLEVGWSLLVRANVVDIEIGRRGDPLIAYRGGYRSSGDRVN